MSGLFAWQLAGDVFKVVAYIFGYLIVASAALRFYFLAELSQFALLTGFSCALGATQAYMATYIIYSALCYGLLLLYLRKK